MPIYEYECCGCGQIHEELQRMSDPPLKKCPSCGGQVNKLMSMNTFHLKGSGWYVTDYAGKKPSTESTSSGEGGTPKAEKAEKKETKTTKTESSAD